MGFIRVRSAVGPKHEFDISEAAYKRNKRAYKVVDRELVVKPRAVNYMTDVPAPVEQIAEFSAKGEL